jgi:U3 small nucleolar RNA-associated protein 23
MSAEWVLCALYVPGETNKHRYVIATQSHPLRVSLRAIPGVPIVHINRSVMVLEPASDATIQFKQRVRYAILQTPLSLHSYVHLTGRARCARAIQVREGGTECGYTPGRTCRKKKETPKGPKSSECEKEGDSCCYHSG